MLELGCQVDSHIDEKLSLDPEGSTAGKAFREKRAFYIPDLQKDPAFAYKDQAKAAGIRSMAAIPLIVGGRVLGILGLLTSLFDQRETLKGEEEEALLAFSNLMAVAMKTCLGEPQEMAKE